MVLRGTSGPNWDGEEAGENCIVRSITICTPRQILFRRSNNVKRIVVVVVVVSKMSLTKAKKHTDIKAALLQREHQTR